MRFFFGSPSATTAMSCERLILLSLVAALYFSVTSAAPSTTSDYEVCQKESCKNIAREYLANMNQSVDPCNDFHEYACGNFAKNHPPNNVTGSTSQFTIVASKVDHRLKEILETEWTPDEPEAVKKAKQFHRSCMDEEMIENSRTKPLNAILQAVGGWPMLSNSTALNQSVQRSWQEVDRYYYKLIGDSPIFSLFVMRNLTNSDQNVLQLTNSKGHISGSPLPFQLITSDRIFERPYLARYKEYIKDVVRAMARDSGSSINETQLEKDAKGIMIFKFNLVNFIGNPVDANGSSIVRPKKSKRIMTISELQDLYDSAWSGTPKSQIKWLERVRELFADVESVSVNSSDKILVAPDYYFSSLPVLLNVISERDIVNTIHWHFVQRMIRYTNREMVAIDENFAESGRSPGEPRPPSQARWELCIIQNELKHAIAYAYVQKHFPVNARESAVGMIRRIEMEMKKEIIAAAWLDAEAKRAAQEKLANMREFIGYPEWYNDSSVLDKRYENLTIGSSHLSNVLVLRKFVLGIELESLRKPVDKSAWGVSPVDVNAFYSPNDNSIIAGECDSPEGCRTIEICAVNYGGIGSTIAHEISHGFDNRGSRYDKDGNLRQWWSNSTYQEYIKRIQCFVDQFNRFEIPSINVKEQNLGRQTLSENIADSTGTRAVFAAFKTRAKESDYRDIRLPGLENFTKEQLFFLSFAEAYCASARQDVFRESALNGKHSVAPLRIIGTLSNTEGFAESFKCAQGTAMNPPNRCGLWYR